MTPAQSTPPTDLRPGSFRWTHTETIRACHDFRHPDQPSPSQRQFARDNGVPRSTLGHWLRHRCPVEADLEPALVAFLDSPSGYRFLRNSSSPCTWSSISSATADGGPWVAF